MTGCAEEAAGEPIGAMLARWRSARGLSQVRLAELLCTAAGTATVTRHEVSRWERQERVPGRFWLGWLAVVLDTPREVLESAAAVARRAAATAPVTGHRLWRPPTAAELLTSLAGAAGDDLRLMAHAWLAGPPGPDPRPLPAHSPPAPGRERLHCLRRMDDLVGGADLAGVVDRELRAAIAAAAADAFRPPRLRLVAGWAQLAGWVHADGGDAPRARRAWAVALRAAAATGDRPLGGHVLGSLSHLYLTAGHPQDALLLAHSGYTGARGRASPRCRALLLHRVALAAARAGERPTAQAALAAAERAGGRASPDREPDWLYWLDEAELSAMTGRCLAALGRPMRAVPLLAAVPPRVGPRTHAIYAAWLARAYVDLGEVERACEVAATAWVAAVRAGSDRAAKGLRHLHKVLLPRREVPAVRGYLRLAATASEYLPVAGGCRPPASGGRQAR